jgi:hypothetical protein
MALGSALAVVGYLEPGLTPLMILGVAVFIIGMLVQWDEGAMEHTIVNLASAAWENVSALVEASGVVNNGIYLPSSAVGDEPMVLIPSTPVTSLGGIKIIGKPLATYGQGATGLLLASPGSRAVAACREVISSDLETSLRNCLVRELSLARGVAVTEGEVIGVRVEGARLIDLYGNSAIRAVLGSVVASIVASIAAEVLNRPIAIQDEARDRGALLVRLRVLGNA